ncbi:MAG: YeeE/YedE family protein [Methylococcales bacterium]|nr:YeeE/YedE family protein [Methylococcales bacterium]
MNLNLSTFASGLIFGLGLIIAQMTNPNKVLAFLDVAGRWDPTLAFVMVGALLTLGILQRFIRKHPKQIQDTDQQALVSPTAKIDAKLAIGSALFGIGWGLAGFCPGPAIVSLTSGLTGAYVFVGAMFIGFFLFNQLHR